MEDDSLYSEDPDSNARDILQQHYTKVFGSPGKRNESQKFVLRDLEFNSCARGPCFVPIGDGITAMLNMVHMDARRFWLKRIEIFTNNNNNNNTNKRREDAVIEEKK